MILKRPWLGTRDPVDVIVKGFVVGPSGETTPVNARDVIAWHLFDLDGAPEEVRESVGKRGETALLQFAIDVVRSGTTYTIEMSTTYG